MPKVKPRTQAKVRLFSIVERALEEGVRIGYRHAHKHTDVPGDGAIYEAIVRAQMAALDEIIDWGDGL